MKNEGRAWRRLRDQVVLRDYGLCHICGHYGADTADHVLAVTEGGPTTLGNLKAAHHKPCPVCSSAAQKPIRCNMLRGGYSIERARKLIRERTGLHLPVDEARSAEPEGRDW